MNLDYLVKRRTRKIKEIRETYPEVVEQIENVARYSSNIDYGEIEDLILDVPDSCSINRGMADKFKRFLATFFVSLGVGAGAASLLVYPMVSRMRIDYGLQEAIETAIVGACAGTILISGRKTLDYIVRQCNYSHQLDEVSKRFKGNL